MDDFFGIGIGEILLVLLVAVIVLGPDRMVEVGRWLGRARNTLRKATSELTIKLDQELQEEKKTQSQPHTQEAGEHGSK